MAAVVVAPALSFAARHATKIAIAAQGAVATATAVGLGYAADFFKPEEVTLTAAQRLLACIPEIDRRLAALAGAAATAGVLVLYAKREPMKIVSVNDSMVAESLIGGSPISARIAPNCQVTLAVEMDNVLNVSGCAIRVDDGLWVLDHVIAPCERGHKIHMITKYGRYEIPSHLIDSATRFASEFRCIHIPDSVFANLRVSKAQFGLLRTTGDVSQIVGPDGQGSQAVLKPKHGFMGWVQYEGSTQAGFSGAAYTINNKVVGLHTHGGHAGNGGQEALYLHTIYKLAAGKQDESRALQDSESYFQKYLEEQDDSLRMEIYEDKYIMRDREGRYHLASIDVVERFKKSKAAYQANPGDWAAEIDYEEDRAAALAAGYEVESVPLAQPAPFLVAGQPRPALPYPMYPAFSMPAPVGSIPSTSQQGQWTFQPYQPPSQKSSAAKKKRYQNQSATKNRPQQSQQPSTPSSSKPSEQQKPAPVTVSQPQMN